MLINISVCQKNISQNQECQRKTFFLFISRMLVLRLVLEEVLMIFSDQAVSQNSSGFWDWEIPNEHIMKEEHISVLTLQTMCTFFSLGLKRKMEIYLYRSCTHSWVHFPYLTFGVARSSCSCPSQWQDLRTLQENICACLSLCLCLHGLVPQL